MDNKIILTIGRQFGSGGREVGQKLAKELGIGYYDKELMTLAVGGQLGRKQAAQKLDRNCVFDHQKQLLVYVF